MNAKSCPLCHGSHGTLREMIPCEHLAHIYRKQLGIEVAALFNDLSVLRFMQCASCGLGYFHPAVPGDDAFYEALQHLDWYYMPDKWEFRMAAGRVGATDSVLEVGCGRGHFSGMLHCGSYVGLETSASAIALAGEAAGLLRHETVETHAEAHPQAYDVVCSFQVLEHVPAPAEFLAACVRCLRPGGLLLLSTPAVECFGSMVVNHELNMPPHHVTHWPERTWRSLPGILPLRLEALEYEPLQPYHHRHYGRTMAVLLARALVGARGGRMVDVSSEHDEALRLADGFDGAVRQVLLDARVAPARGHTVFVTYRKTEDA